MKHLKVLFLALFSIFLYYQSSFAVFILENGLGNWAIVSNLNNGTISIVDPETGTAYGPFFDGVLPDDIYEVKVTPDGKKALLASFYEQKIYFIDLNNPTSPSILGSVDVSPLYAENLAISPNGKCAVIGDGSTSLTKLTVIDIDTMSVAQQIDVDEVEDVSISPDGQVIVTSEYYNGLIHVFSFDQSNCTISDTGNTYSLTKPNNSEFSEDGKTLIVAEAEHEKVAIFEVNGTTLTNQGEIDLGCGTIPSVDIYGNKAYAVCSDDKLAILDITGPGQVSDTGIRVDVSVNFPTWVKFGVNQIAITPDGKYALISSEAQNNFVSVVDLNTNTEVRTITTDNNSISVATIPIVNPTPPHVENGKMYGRFVLNGSVISTKLPCIKNVYLYPRRWKFYLRWGHRNFVKAKSIEDVVCYDSPLFTPPGSLDFDTMDATLTGLLNGRIPVTIEVEMSDGGSSDEDYAHIIVLDEDDNTIYEADGTIERGYIRALRYRNRR